MLRIASLIRQKFVYLDRGIWHGKLANWLIAIAVLVIVLLIIIATRDKGTSFYEYLASLRNLGSLA